MQTSVDKASTRPTKAPKLKAKTPKQSQRFIEAARAAECSEDEAVFDANLRRLAKAKPHKTEKPDPER
jgi:hypothetical protein